MSQPKHILLVLTALTLVWWCGCGGGSDNEFRTDTPRTPNRGKTGVKKTIAPNPKKGPLFKEVKFLSKTRVNEDLQVETVLSEPAGDDVDFSYRWVVNDEEIPDVDSNTLPKRYFKKDDWVYCIVTGKKEGGETRTLKSKFVRISGMTPVLDLAPVGKFSVPGEFKYKIKASLPTQEEFFQEQESIRLKYELIGPLDAGIKLNPETGVLTWNITTDTVETFGKEIQIKFKVTNPGSGGEVTSSIILTFTPTAERPEETAETKEEE